MFSNPSIHTPPTTPPPTEGGVWGMDWEGVQGEGGMG